MCVVSFYADEHPSTSLALSRAVGTDVLRPPSFRDSVVFLWTLPLNRMTSGLVTLFLFAQAPSQPPVPAPPLDDLSACVCHTSWTAASDGCTSPISGCPETPCDGDPLGSWCIVDRTSDPYCRKTYEPWTEGVIDYILSVDSSGWDATLGTTATASGVLSYLRNPYRSYMYCALTGPSPSPPSPPSLPPPLGLAKQDPHLSGAHGDTMDFRGRHGVLYAILSVPRLTFSLRTQNATFIKPGYMPKLVHGSFFTDAYWKVTTTDGDVFVVNTSAHNIGFDVVDPHGKVVASKPRVWTELNRHDMRVLYKQETLVMRVAGWETNVTRKPIYNRLSGPEWRLDLSIRPLNGTGFEGRHGNASGLIAPHGIIGQTWDDDSIAVDGKQDDYEHSGVEVWTTSMAEGGIEGQASEYELENKMTHEFKYARHEKTSYTPPRDVSRLTGTRRIIGELRLSATAVDQTGIGYRQ